MYAIAHVIYGTYVPSDVFVDIPQELPGWDNKDWLDIDGKISLADWIAEGDDEPFQVHYRGGDMHGIYAGVELDSFDEDCDAVDLAMLKLSPTGEQYDLAQSELARIPEWMREHLPPVGTYIVWSSS